MTTITTVEELRGVPDGRTIRIIDPRNGTKVWTKEGERFVLDGMQIDESLLRAAINAAAIETGPIFQQGQVIHNGYYEHYVLRVRPDDSALILSVYDRFYPEQTTTWTDRPEGNVLTEMDDRQRALQAMGETLAQQHDVNQQIRDREQSLRDEHQRHIESIADTLGDVMRSFDDDDDKDRLRHSMRGMGLRVPSRDVDYRITVEVTTDAVDIPGEVASRIIGDEISARDITAAVSFTHVIEITESYDGDNSDPCEDRNVIDEDWARDRLVEEGISVDEVTIESRSCNHC